MFKFFSKKETKPARKPAPVPVPVKHAFVQVATKEQRAVAEKLAPKHLELEEV